MSLNKTNEKCAVCQAYLFEDDDTVYCPECGAPHHRECYNSVGHCGLEQFHGTDSQYKRSETQNQEVTTKQEIGEHESENTVVCNMCGAKYDKQENACPNCDTPNVAKFGGRFITFDFLGGVPSDTDLGEGVTAEEAKRFVVSNTHRYIPKFLKFKSGKKLSWNWLAFITPCGWFLSRKMYGIGAFLAALQIAFKILMFPIANIVYEYLPMIENQGAAGLSPELAVEILSKIGILPIVIVWGIALINLAIMLISAMFGDYIYKKHVISTIVKIKADSEDIDNDFRKKGGVNLLLGIIGFYLFTPFFI